MVENPYIIEAKTRCQEAASQLVHIRLSDLDLLGPVAGETEVDSQGARSGLGITRLVIL